MAAKAKSCERTKGHEGPHACQYVTEMYDTLMWWTSLGGRTAWRKLQWKMTPEPSPHCGAAFPELPWEEIIEDDR
jgi:hypothetical protein